MVGSVCRQIGKTAVEPRDRPYAIFRYPPKDRQPGWFDPRRHGLQRRIEKRVLLCVLSEGKVSVAG